MKTSKIHFVYIGLCTMQGPCPILWSSLLLTGKDGMLMPPDPALAHL